MTASVNFRVKASYFLSHVQFTPRPFSFRMHSKLSFSLFLHKRAGICGCPFTEDDDNFFEHLAYSQLD